MGLVMEMVQWNNGTTISHVSFSHSAMDMDNDDTTVCMEWLRRTTRDELVDVTFSFRQGVGCDSEIRRVRNLPVLLAV